LEHDLVYNIKIKESIEEKQLLLEENLSLCREENTFLKERLKNYDENQNEEQFKLFENEILKIREMLKEKTTEFIKFENAHKKNYEELSKNFNQVKNNLEEIKEENDKYSQAMKNISLNLDQNNLKEIGEIIKSMSEYKFNFTLLQQETKQKLNELNNFEDNENLQIEKALESRFDPITILDNERNLTFAEKVIQEFDKVFNNEIKRLQNNYKKPEELKVIKTQTYRRRSSGVKNYIVYNGKSPNQKFAEGLRNKEKSPDELRINRRGSINSSFADNFSMMFNKNSILNSSVLSDVDSLVGQAKDRVRLSISFGEKNKEINEKKNIIDLKSSSRNGVDVNRSMDINSIFKTTKYSKTPNKGDYNFKSSKKGGNNINNLGKNNK
jgi:hypothetical protein